MKTIYITKKLSDSNNLNDILKKKLKRIEKKWRCEKVFCPIKLVFEEGIKKINLNVLTLRDLTVEVIYPDSLVELPNTYFANAQKIIIPNNLKEIHFNDVSHSKLRDINLHNNLEVIGNNAFLNNKNLNIIHIYPSVKEIGHGAFSNTNINKFIFLNKDVKAHPSAFYDTKIDKLYCANEYLLNDIINNKNTIINELIIPIDLITKLAKSLKEKEKKIKLSSKLIIDCPDDFYHNIQYQNELKTINNKLIECKIILSHDYVIENFKEVKDIYKEPKTNFNSKKINNKCNQILDCCSNIKLKRKVLKYLIDIVNKYNNTVLSNYNYDNFNSINLSINSYETDINTIMNKLNDILNKVKLLNDNTYIYICDIETLVTEVNIININLNYLDKSLYSDICKYLYILELTNPILKEKYKSNLLKVITKYKNNIIKNFYNNIHSFPNINILYKNVEEFELEFRKKFFNELLSFYKDYLKSIDIDIQNIVSTSINNIYDTNKYNQRNIYYKVIASLIEEINNLDYIKDNHIIILLNDIANLDLEKLEDNSLRDIINKLSKIKYFLEYREIKLYKLVKRN